MTSDPGSRTETIPHGLRSLVRASELGIVVLAALVGVLAGLVVIAMNWATQALHEIIFRIPAG
ncbi:MAG TPA: chloride channel protein, partial [Ancylobacter sp.]